ncbi:MAG: MmcQ/YjbR family DNA-binding protein [Thermoanaerobaculia bacterium]
MPTKKTAPSRATDLLRKVSDICLTLPEASVEHSSSYATFRVRKKVFAYFLDDHHGDGIVSVCVKTRLGENQDLAKQDPVRFYLPAYIGPRGWVGLRLDVAPIRWNEVKELVRSSYRAVAPKKLVTATSG